MVQPVACALSNIASGVVVASAVNGLALGALWLYVRRRQ